MVAVAAAILAGAALAGTGAQIVQGRREERATEQSARRQARAVETRTRQLQQQEAQTRATAVQAQARRRRRALLGSLSTGRQGTILTGPLGGLGQTPQSGKTLLGA